MRDPAVSESIGRALHEDLSGAGDVTTRATIPPDVVTEAAIVARTAGTVAGLGIARQVFAAVDATVAFHSEVGDGTAVDGDSRLARVEGLAASILTAERTALNFLGHLSGIATATSDLVRRVEGTGARIVDTRKTTPGLRALEKYAVRMGGGSNHRFGLYDAVLLKDNHIAIAGGIRPAVERARAGVGHMVKIQVEVDTLTQLDELLEVGADAVLLDNMAPAVLTEAVGRIDGRMITEASGNITPADVRQIAETGVDYISVGWITHSSPRLDVALDT